MTDITQFKERIFGFSEDVSAQAGPPRRTGLVEGYANQAVEAGLASLLNALPMLGQKLGAASASANDTLTDFTSLLSTLHTNLEMAESRDQTLWYVHEVETSIAKMLNGTPPTIEARLHRMFLMPTQLRTCENPYNLPIPMKTINEITTKLHTFREKLLEYREILEGKKPASRTELFNLRHYLIHALRAPQEGDPDLTPKKSELFNLTLVKDANLIRADEDVMLDAASEIDEHTLVLTEGEFLDKDADYRRQVTEALARADRDQLVEIPVEIPQLEGPGVLDIFHAIKGSREGCFVDALDTLGTTVIASAARKTSEFFFCSIGWKSGGVISDDDLDLPPLELKQMHIVDQRNGVDPQIEVDVDIIERGTRSGQLSIGRLAEIFTGFVIRGEKDGLYELWANVLQAYFKHMEKNLEEIQASPDGTRMRGVDTTLAHVKESIEHITHMLAVKEPSKSLVQETFAKVGTLMNQHPLLVLHVAEFDPGSLLTAVDEGEQEDLLGRIGKSLSQASPQVEATINTTIEEQEEFRNLIEQTGQMAHLYSVYSTVSYLMGGNKDGRMQFQEVYESIDKTGLNPDQIKAKFVEKLTSDVLFADNTLWCIHKWLIRLFLWPIVWGLGLGVNQFVSGVQHYMDGFVEEMELGSTSKKSEVAMERLEAAFECISNVTKDDRLRTEANRGKGAVFKKGLLQTPDMLSSKSTDGIYASFTENMIEQFFMQPTNLSDFLTSADRSIADNIGNVNIGFGFVRAVLTVASMVVRIPIWVVNSVVVKPFQWGAHWITKKTLKVSLVYMEVVKNVVDTTKEALASDKINQTEVTPIIDRSILELLHTLWSALHTGDEGEIDSEDIDFEKFQATPQQKRKLTNALSAVFKAVDDVDRMETNAHHAVPTPVIGTFLDYFKYRGQDLGLNASSDVAIAAVHTLTRPEVVYHMLNTGMGTLLDSMRATDTVLSNDADDQVRKDITKMVKQIVSLSTHRARQVLTEAEEVCDEPIRAHIGKMKRTFLVPDLAPTYEVPKTAALRDQGLKDTEYTDMITNWKKVLEEYCNSETRDQDTTGIVAIRGELFTIWRSLQEDYVLLNNDRTTKTASFNVHDRQLRKVEKSLSEFQNEYMIILNAAVRRKFQSEHSDELRLLDQASAFCGTISTDLVQCRELLKIQEHDDELGELAPSILERYESNVQLAEAIYGQLQESLADRATQITDDLRRLVSSSKTQVDFLKALSERLKRHAELAKFTKETLGLKLLRNTADNTSIKEQLIRERKSKYDVCARMRAELKKHFPDYSHTKSRDQEVFEKAMSALKILESSSTEADILKQVAIIENLLSTTCKRRAKELERYVQQGITITTAKKTKGKAELDLTKSPAESSEKDALVTFRKTHLAQAQSALNNLHRATNDLEEVHAVQWNLDTDLTSVPFMRQLLQVANHELESKIMSLYTKVAANPDITEFLFLRNVALPFVDPEA